MSVPPAGRRGATSITTTRRTGSESGTAWLPGSLVWRVAILAVIVVFVQISVVSEIPVFGVSVDLTPLLVAFIGLLCGSTLRCRRLLCRAVGRPGIDADTRRDFTHIHDHRLLGRSSA